MPPECAINVASHSSNHMTTGEFLSQTFLLFFAFLLFCWVAGKGGRRKQRDTQTAKDATSLDRHELVIGETVLIFTEDGIMCGSGKLLGALQDEVMVSTGKGTVCLPFSRVAPLKKQRMTEPLN